MIIRNGNLHIGDGRILERTDLRILNGKIAEISKGLSGEDEGIIDADGKEVFPGFIDPVSCIGAMGMPAKYLDNREATNPIHPEMCLKYSVDPDELSAQEFYKSGITTVGLAPDNSNIMGGQIAVFKTPELPYKERMVTERGLLKCSITSNVKKTYGDKSMMPMTKMGIFYLLEKAFQEVERKNPDEYDEKEKVIAQILSGEKKICVAAEKMSEIQAMVHFCKQRKISLTVVDGYDFHKCLEEIKENQTNLILGNIANLSKVAKHKMELNCLLELIENGNLIAFTTTSGGWPEGREVMLWNAIDVYRAGIPAEEVVKMMTSNPAKILGLENRIGSLTVGCDADISIFTGHPVTTYQARVSVSIVNGEVVYHE